MTTALSVLLRPWLHICELAEKLTGTVQSQVFVGVNLFLAQELVMPSVVHFGWVLVKHVVAGLHLSVLLVPIAVSKVVLIWGR